jgi:hypothetical protein
MPSGGRSPSLCSIPWQGDFPRGNVPTGKDALRSIHRNLDDRPISMKLYEFAANHRYYMTAKANAPLQREVLLAHLRNMQAAMKEVSKLDPAGL